MTSEWWRVERCRPFPAALGGNSEAGIVDIGFPQYSSEERTVCMKTRIAMLAIIAVGFLVVAGLVDGHAILKETTPAANSKVAGPDVPMVLKYNVRIDAKLSKLMLLNPDNSTTDLKIDEQKSADTLTSKATGLKPGAYKIRWQVLAPDGHITRGEIPFTVTGN